MNKRLALAWMIFLPAFAGCAVDSNPGAEDPGTQEDGLKVCAKGSTLRGVDVSYYQGTIDWAKVKAHGISFAIARVADGTGFVDPTFGANWAGMKAHGIVRGSYQFFRPEHDPVAQANLMVQQIKAHGGLQAGDLPPVLDVEVQDGVSDATMRSRILTWASHVESATGRRPMIYTAPGFWNGIGAGSEFAKYPLWVANWQTSCPGMPNSWSGWKFWQDADNGSVPGISGHVDTDVFNGTLADLHAFAGTPGGGGSSGGSSGGRTGPVSLGGDVAAAPGVGRNPDGRLEVFAVGHTGNLVTAFQTAPNGGWSGWFSLGGKLEGRPAVANDADGRLEVFVRSSGGAMEHAWQDAPNGKIGAFASLGGTWASDPSVARNADGRLEVFAQNAAGAVEHVWQVHPSGAWSGWSSLGSAGGGLVDPRAIAGHDGRLRVFARGADGAIHVAVQESGKWSGWSSLGGKATSAPTVTLSGGGELGLFVRGSDGALWHAWEQTPGGAWSKWISLGGGIHDPFAATDADGRMEVFARGNDAAAWHIEQKGPGGTWGSWTKLGGTISGQPTAGHDKDGRLEVFFRETDGTVRHVWEKAPEVW